MRLFKPTLMVVLFCISIIKAKAQEQRNFNLPQVQEALGEDSTLFVYITALWCKPCLDKMPALDAYFEKAPTKTGLIYLFDQERFDLKILQRLFPFITWQNNFSLIPASFYPNKKIVVNPHEKMFANYQAYLQSNFPNTTNISAFNLSGMMILKKGKPIKIFELPDVKGMNRKEMDAVFSAYLNE